MLLFEKGGMGFELSLFMYKQFKSGKNGIS
jgi:hypothetical protein